MLSIHSFSGGVLAEIIRRQPASKEKTAFVWQLAVGHALARVTTVELVERTLQVRAVDPRWSAEIVRAEPLILKRLQQWLGPDAVSRLQIAA
jgi:Dna[CI] antecedent, DciA